MMPNFGTLRDVLQKVQPNWTSLVLDKVEKKLAEIEIHDVPALSAALKGQLNSRLSDAGLKTFQPDTVKSLRVLLGVRQERQIGKKKEHPNQNPENEPDVAKTDTLKQSAFHAFASRKNIAESKMSSSDDMFALDDSDDLERIPPMEEILAALDRDEADASYGRNTSSFATLLDDEWEVPPLEDILADLDRADEEQLVKECRTPQDATSRLGLSTAPTQTLKYLYQGMPTSVRSFKASKELVQPCMQESLAAKQIPTQANSSAASLKDSKWSCPTCDEINKVARTECNNCGGKKPQADSLCWSKDIQYSTDYFQKICHILHRHPGNADVVKAANGDQCTFEEFLDFEGESFRQQFPIKIRIQQESLAAKQIPTQANSSAASLKDSKWSCPTCEEINKAARTECHNCGGKKPQAYLSTNDFQFEATRTCTSLNISTRKDRTMAANFASSSAVPCSTLRMRMCRLGTREPLLRQSSGANQGMVSHIDIPEGYAIVPMGHFCPTAAFLIAYQWRNQALPLDWSCSTYKVWKHMIEDDFETLLAIPDDEDPRGRNHPYNQLYQDTLMFMHQADWAKKGETRLALERRTHRLRQILQGACGFGVSFYFDGQENVHATFDEILKEGLELSDGHGFFHIVLVWFEKRSSMRPSSKWVYSNEKFSALRYTPYQKMGWGQDLHGVDSAAIANSLSKRFPQIFGKQLVIESDEEEDAIEMVDTIESWQQLWDFERGHIRS